MPVLSKFYGIIIRMAFSKGCGAHFHATYEDSEIVVGLNPLRIIQGDAPARVRTLVLEWAQTHYFELMEAWRCCSDSRPAERIAPLR